jgi:protein phosphatase
MDDDVDRFDDDAVNAAERRRLFSAPVRPNLRRPLSADVVVEFGACSKASPHRGSNRDHYIIQRLSRKQETITTSLQSADLPGLFEEFGYAMVVADGGEFDEAGALASRIALSTLAHFAIHGDWNLRIDPATAQEVINRAEWFYELVARVVDQQGVLNPELSDMCTTMTLTFSAGDDLFFAHVGNSRAYLFREGDLIQLTRDHTLDQQVSERRRPLLVPSATLRSRRMLADAIGGGRGAPRVDVERVHLRDGDVVLVCTDGLCRIVDDDRIAAVLAHPRQLIEQCRMLTDLALSLGGDDDVTALLAKYVIPDIPDAGRTTSGAGIDP